MKQDHAIRRLSGLCAGLILLLTTTLACAATTVRLSVPPWPGAEVKAHVVTQILDALGYQTKTISLAPTLAIKSVSAGTSDALLDVWIPSQKSTLDSVMKDGHVTVAGTNLHDALYGVVVPDYVWKAGVHSLADLHKYPDKFGSSIYGIDPGSDGNLIMKHAIDKNTYDLEGWKVVPSTTAAMLAEAKQKIDAHEWVAFLGWKPHWMNVVYHLKYLQDPKGIWGDNYVIQTIANKAFLAKHPNVKRFLAQFVVTSKAQSAWIYDFSFKDVPAKKVAHQWIASHADVVAGWLDGVTTADGKTPADKAVKQVF